jgi:hypothetical protein
VRCYVQVEAGAYLRTFPRRVCIQAYGPTATEIAGWAVDALLQPNEDEIYLVHPVAAMDDDGPSESESDSVSAHSHQNIGCNKGSS